MPNTRISPIEPPFAPEVQAEFDKIMRGAPPLLLFRTVARNPRVLQRDGSLADCWTKAASRCGFANS